MSNNTQAIFLTEGDQAILKKLIADQKSKSVNTLRLIEDELRHRTRAMYIALPETEITALEEYGATTGTGTGTSTVEAGDADVPGSGLCTLYRLTVDGLDPLGRTEIVYNSSRTAIARDWIQVHQDNFGKWWAITGGGGEGVQTIRFRITDPANCELCTSIAEVISRPYGVTTVHEEELGLVTILDRMGGFLNEPIDSLIGRIGYATYLTSQEEGPCPGLPTTGWEITSLNCAEEAC